MDFTPNLSDDALLHELGQRLAQLRLARNLRQDTLAHEAGLSLRTLTRIESGEPSQTTNVLRVLRALGLLANLESLVPLPVPSPLLQLELQGRARKRATRKATKAGEAKAMVNEPKAAWQWQED